MVLRVTLPHDFRLQFFDSFIVQVVHNIAPHFVYSTWPSLSQSPTTITTFSRTFLVRRHVKLTLRYFRWFGASRGFSDTTELRVGAACEDEPSVRSTPYPVDINRIDSVADRIDHAKWRMFVRRFLLSVASDVWQRTAAEQSTEQSSHVTRAARLMDPEKPLTIGIHR